MEHTASKNATIEIWGTNGETLVMFTHLYNRLCSSNIVIDFGVILGLFILLIFYVVI